MASRYGYNHEASLFDDDKTTILKRLLLFPFLLQQGVSDQLYNRPRNVTEEDKAASCFLRALAFTDQVNTMTTKTLPTSQLLQWLNSARGLSLVEAGREHDQRSALALVLTPECLYDPDSSRVGLALVYKPIYVKTVSFGEAYFHLKTAGEAASGKIIDPLIMFVLLSGSSEVIPRPNDHPLFLDVSSPSYIEETGPLQRVQCFRGFKLHRAICLYAGESISHVAYPGLEGGRESYYMLPQRQKITPEILESLRLTVSLAPVDEGHWNIVNDPIYPACLDQFRERHEAASKNPTSQQFQVPDVSQMFGPMATPSDSTVPTPTLPSTLPLGSEDVNRIVQETLDTFHDLGIEAIQGMGAIREIDRSLSKGIMSEFLRLQLIVCNDLSKSLTSLRSEVGTLTQSLLRDLGLAIQSDWGTSSGSAVKAALQRFQDMMVLRMNLPLAQLDAARVDMDDFLDLRLREIRSREESTRVADTLAKRVTEQHEKIKQVIQNAPLDDPRIAHRVSIGLNAEQPLEVTVSRNAGRPVGSLENPLLRFRGDATLHAGQSCKSMGRSSS